MLRRQTDYTKFIVLAKARTGSSMLCKILGWHWNIKASGELFARLKGRDPRGILDAFFVPRPGRIQAAGFKIHYQHPADASPERTWDLLANEPGLHVIHLGRRNVLRTLLSMKISRRLRQHQLGRFAKRPGIESRRTEITARELRGEIRKTEKFHSEFSDRFRQCPVLELAYEDLVEDPAGEFARALEFLRVRPRKPIISTAAMNPEPLSELILNYRELKAEFADTPASAMFD